MRPARAVVRRTAITLLSVVALLAALAPGAFAQEAGTSPDATFTPPREWSRARVEGAPAGLAFADVIAGGPGFIAVGGGWRDGEDGEARPAAEIWVSTDGRSWTRVPLAGVAAVGQIRAITATPDGYVAVGGRCCPDQAMVWRSSDGLAWEVDRDVAGLADAVMLGVTAMPDGGLVAVGCAAVMECMGGLSWRSVDGTTWEPPVALELIPFDVAAAAGGVVVVGSTEPYEGDPSGAVSPDGTAWTLGDLDLTGGTLLGILGEPDSAMAVGASRDPDTMATSGLLAGTDGTDWGSLDGAAVPGATFEDLLWLGGVPSEGTGGMLIGGWTQDDQGATTPATWWSTDGESWTRGTFPSSMKGEGMLVALAVGPDGTTVAVGSMTLNRGQVPAAWVSGLGHG